MPPKDAGYNNFFQIFIVYRQIPKISDPKKSAVITLKVEHDGFTLEYCIQKMQRELQTVKTLIREEQSDLGLHCLPRSVCPKT